MSTLTNDQITAAAAVLDLDLDELQALCDAVKRPWYGTLQIADGVTDDDAAKFIEAFSPDTVSELIAAVRHAPSPQIAEKVELPKPWAQRFNEGEFTSVALAKDAEIAELRNAIAASRRAAPRDVCAEMRALCSACGGTGDVVSLDGEWRGTCDCEASRAPASAGQAAPALPRELADAEIVEVLASLGTDAEKSVYDWNPVLQVRTTVPAIRQIVAAYLKRAAQPAEGAGQAGQVANDCETCSGSGVVGFPPDQYEHCTDCATERAAAPAEQPSAQVKP